MWHQFATKDDGRDDPGRGRYAQGDLDAAGSAYNNRFNCLVWSGDRDWRPADKPRPSKNPRLSRSDSLPLLRCLVQSLHSIGEVHGLLDEVSDSPGPIKEKGVLLNIAGLVVAEGLHSQFVERM